MMVVVDTDGWIPWILVLVLTTVIIILFVGKLLSMFMLTKLHRIGSDVFLVELTWLEACLEADFLVLLFSLRTASALHFLP